jgi:hypothetical protein
VCVRVIRIHACGCGRLRSAARLVSAPQVSLFAGVGYVAVFAGAANAPITGMVLGAELLGARGLVYLGAGCLTAYIFSGVRGVFIGQDVAISNKLAGVPRGTNSMISSLRMTNYTVGMPQPGELRATRKLSEPGFASPPSNSDGLSWPAHSGSSLSNGSRRSSVTCVVPEATPYVPPQLPTVVELK